jgi:hypothetical protein
MTTDNFCFYLQRRLIQTSQTGGQWYSDTFPFSIPCPKGIGSNPAKRKRRKENALANLILNLRLVKKLQATTH